MLIIDGVYVNTGGGLVLLEYLVSCLEQKDADVYYLFDERTKSVFSHISLDKCQFIKNSHFARKKFYTSLNFKINKVFCFGNAPLSLKLGVPVFVYFHNNTLIKSHSDMNLQTKFLCFIKQLFIYYYKKNVDQWFVQNQYVQIQFAKKFIKNNLNQISILPFYPKMDYPKNVNRVKNTFFYVSTTYPHKNHVRLIEAFCSTYDCLKKGKLTLTVPFTDIELCELINEKIKSGYPIENIGYINRELLAKVYKESEFLIFPSLTETFGLGLVEAIDAGCKVLAADLPYTYQVCSPSLTFDPFSVESISEAIYIAIKYDLPESTNNINNDIEKLINLLI